MQTVKKIGRGYIRGYILGYILIVLLGLLLSGCGGKAEPEFVPPTRRPAPPTLQPAAEPKVMIERAIDAEFAETTERMHMTVSKNGNLLEMDLDFVAPDRYYMNLQGIELIVIGSQGYAKVDGKWHADPNSGAKLDENLNDIVRDSIQVLDAEFIEQVTYKGEATHVYTFRMTWTDNQGEKISEGKMWLRVADGLPVKSEENLFLGDLRYHLNYQLEYGLDLKIEPPI